MLPIHPIRADQLEADREGGPNEEPRAVPPAVEQSPGAGTREGAVDGQGGPAPLVRHERGGAQKLGQLECADPWPNFQTGAL